MLDPNLTGLLTGIVKNIPGTAANAALEYAERAETAQSAAENAAELAATRNYGVSVSGTTLVFTENTSE